jgi:hypothetical protein
MSTHYSDEAITAYFSERLGESITPNSKGQASALCPFHQDTNPSLSLNTRMGVWKCHAGCGGGDMEQFERRWLKNSGQSGSMAPKESIAHFMEGAEEAESGPTLG